jgi:exopolyphosphatase/pppGpp-phosphohydrolase
VGREELTVLCGHLAVVRRAERRRLPGLKAGRADAIVAGAVVFDELVRAGGYAGLLVAEHGVRHGVLLRETFERRASSARWRMRGPAGWPSSTPAGSWPSLPGSSCSTDPSGPLVHGCPPG